MKEELIVIENGIIEERGNPLFTDLYLQIYKSEILGIVFDNVIDRQCILDLFRGERALDGGKVLIGKKRNDYMDALLFFRDNATIIEKHSKLIDNLTIEENILLFTDKNNFISERKYKNNFQALLQKFDLNITLNKPMESLSARERVIIELLKAYYEDKKLVVLSYISGLLLNNDMNDIHSLLLKLKMYGMSFIIIEAFNNNIFEWVNSFLIIQNGKTAGIFDSSSYNSRLLYSVLIKKDNSIKRPSEENEVQSNGGDMDIPLLEFKNVYTTHIKDLNLEIEAGELLKVFYMDDDSCEHIIDLLKGNIKPLSGDILLNSQSLRIDDISQAVRKGVCFIEETPYENMLFYNMTLKDNLGLALSSKVPLFWFRKRYKKSLDYLMKSLQLEEYANVKLRKLDPRILQVIAYFKWYLYAPHVVVCIKPFTEMDINLQEITIDMIMHLKSRGIAVIILTSVLSDTRKMEGDTVYIKNGSVIDENEVYQTLFKG